MHDTPETSDYTSIQERISPTWSLQKAINAQFKETAIELPNPIKPLLRFKANNEIDPADALPMTLIDYLELVDWTGRIVREDKRGHINNETPPIAQRLSLKTDDWLQQSIHFEEIYRKHYQRKISSNTS